MKQTTEWSLFIDGASRNNPGPSGAGIYLLKNGEPFLQQGYFLGTKTNNQAEYLALLLGLFLLEPLLAKDDLICVFSDSQLLVRQLNGIYKIKEASLVPLYTCAKNFLFKKNYVLEHILRYNNAAADKLANLGINRQTEPPGKFEQFCERYENS